MKKRVPFISLFKNDFFHNYKRYWLICSIFLVGIVAGSLGSSFSASKEVKEYMDVFLSSFPLQGVAKAEIFKISFMNHLTFFLFLCLSGWHIILFSLGILQIFLKGFRIGFTISSLLHFYHFRGLLLSFCALFPQNAILLPAMTLFIVYQMNFLFEHRCQSIRKNLNLKNILISFVFFFFILLTSLIEGYLIPSMIQLMGNFFLS